MKYLYANVLYSLGGHTTGHHKDLSIRVLGSKFLQALSVVKLVIKPKRQDGQDK
jgi:hypothetical protein